MADLMFTKLINDREMHLLKDGGAISAAGGQACVGGVLQTANGVAVCSLAELERVVQRSLQVQLDFRLQQQ